MNETEEELIRIWCTDLAEHIIEVVKHNVDLEKHNVDLEKHSCEHTDEWHWLTRNPNDLPKVGSTVITYWRNANAKGVAVFDYAYLEHCDEYGNFCEADYVGFVEQSGCVRLPLNSTRNPIKAWRYLPAIPEEEE